MTILSEDEILLQAAAFNILLTNNVEDAGNSAETGWWWPSTVFQLSHGNLVSTLKSLQQLKLFYFELFPD